MSDRIEVTAEPAELILLPGETGEVSASIRNLGQTVDQMILSVEGLDESWYTIPVSSVALFPNDQDNLKITIHPPKTSESGSHPFQINVASQEDPSEIATAQVAIEIKALLEVGMEISPLSLAGRKASYQIVAANPGEREATVKLLASDPKNRLRYRFQLDRLTVDAAGRSGTSLEVRLGWMAFLGGEKPFEFKVAALPPGGDAPVQDFCPYCGRKLKPVSGTALIFCPHCDHLLNEKAKFTSAEFVRTPLIKGLPRIGLPSWFYRKPVISSFEVATDDKREFKLTWAVKRAKEVTLDSDVVKSEGEMTVRPAGVTEYTITVANKRRSVSQTLEVHPLPIAAEKPSDRIRASLSQTELQVQAGTVPTQATLQLQNMGEIVDKFLVEVVGLDSAWYGLSASSVALMPQATDQVQIPFHPPKQEGVKAGKYPFAINVRSESVPGEVTTVLGQLEILPFPEFTLQIRPVRINCRRKGVFRIELTNVGVSDITFNLEASDMEEGCRFGFKDNAPVLPAWKSIEIPMKTKPKRGSFVGEKKVYNIGVTASDGSNSQTGNCDLTHKPLFSSWKTFFKLIRAIVMIVIVAVLIYLAIHWGGGWNQLTSDPGRWAEELTDEWPPWEKPFDVLKSEEGSLVSPDDSPQINERAPVPRKPNIP